MLNVREIRNIQKYQPNNFNVHTFLYNLLKYKMAVQRLNKIEATLWSYLKLKLNELTGLKVRKSRKLIIVSSILPKNERWHNFQYIKFSQRSFFGSIGDTINCFRHLLTFSQIKPINQIVSTYAASANMDNFFLNHKPLQLARDSRYMSYEAAAILNQNHAYIPHIIG